MRTLVVLATVAATAVGSSLAFTSPALAVADSDQIVAGVVKTFDPLSDKVRLTNGEVFKVPSDYRGPALAAGEKLEINWFSQAGEKIATRMSVIG